MDNIFYTNIAVFLTFIFLARSIGYGSSLYVWVKMNDTVAVWTYVTWLWLSVLSVPAFVIYKVWSA